MSFINRLLNRPVVLDLYTTRQDVINFSPPLVPSKAYPDWWKGLPREIKIGNALGGSRTMKHCLGFTELFTRGVMIPLWSDLEVEIGPVGTDNARWQFADQRSFAEVHPQLQRGGYLPETQYQHLKLASPWKAVCKDDVQWVLTQPSWNFDRPDSLLIPPAVIDFKYQSDVHVNMFIPRTQLTETITLDQGQPMLHFVPITERRVEYRTHLITQDEFNNIGIPHLWFMDSYRKHKKIVQSCPMKKFKTLSGGR